MRLTLKQAGLFLDPANDHKRTSALRELSELERHRTLALVVGSMPA